MPAPEAAEHYTDEWAQNVVNAWGVNVSAGNARLLTEEFKSLLDLACRYREARSLADNHRQFNMLKWPRCGRRKAKATSIRRGIPSFSRGAPSGPGVDSC